MCSGPQWNITSPASIACAEARGASAATSAAAHITLRRILVISALLWRLKCRDTLTGAKGGQNRSRLAGTLLHGAADGVEDGSPGLPGGRVEVGAKGLTDGPQERRHDGGVLLRPHAVAV